MYSRTLSRATSAPMRQASARAQLAQAARRRPTNVTSKRLLQTDAPGSTASGAGAGSSHAVAGVAGGAAVLLGLYGWYHMSGTAKVVNTSRQVIDQAQQAKDKLVQQAPSFQDGLGIVRSIAKSYAAAIPGAGGAVDAAFDQLDKLAKDHGPEVQKLVKDTYDDLVKAAQSGKDASDKIASVLTEAAQKVQNLVGAESEKLLGTLKEKFPDAGNALSQQYDELNKLAGKHGPEASRIASSFYNDAAAIVSKGGLNAQTLESVQKLLREKTNEVKDFSQRAGKDAWEASAKSASPLLDKMPDVRKLVDDNVERLSSVVGEDKAKAIKDMYGELEKISKSGKSFEDMKKDAQKLVESKVGTFEELRKKAGDKGGDLKDQAFKYFESATGLTGFGKTLEGIDLKELRNVAEKHGEEGQKILSSAYDEIKEILQKKSEEAKKVGEQAAQDAKKVDKVDQTSA
ncbi:hypothetical protein OIV83_005318 [Microbotryomycetes sp. JL201]|nr:hypothetical protein OIV83_005318 [Microbotryomycetes sp. JL201]